MNRRYVYPRGPLGELPETLQYERRPQREFDPNAGLYLDWYNRFTCVNYGVLVGTANITTLQDNALRTYLLIQNNHAANTLFVSFGSEATSFASIQIKAGGNYELIGGQDGGGFCMKSSVNLAASAINTNVVIVEGALEPISQSGRPER